MTSERYIDISEDLLHDLEKHDHRTRCAEDEIGETLRYSPTSILPRTRPEAATAIIRLSGLPAEDEPEPEPEQPVPEPDPAEPLPVPPDLDSGIVAEQHNFATAKAFLG